MAFKKNVLLPLAMLILGAFSSYIVGRAQAKDALAQVEKDHRKAFYQQLRLHLDGSWAAFQNQVSARNRLIALLEDRYGRLPGLEYEALFRRYHASFNEEEKFLCELMRGITFTAVTQHNEAVNKLLRENPQYSVEIEESGALREHLDLWLSKAAAMKDRPDVCLVYIGVEENRPFPSGVSESVNRILHGL